MQQTVKPIIDLLNKRMKQRVEAMQALSLQPLDNVPDAVKKMREEEASKIRAVIQEQADLIEIIQMLYPTNAQT